MKDFIMSFNLSEIDRSIAIIKNSFIETLNNFTNTGEFTSSAVDDSSDDSSQQYGDIDCYHDIVKREIMSIVAYMDSLVKIQKKELEIIRLKCKSI